MSWLQNINNPGSIIYYASIDPEEYYEWKHNSAIRSGTIFDSKRFPIDKIASGKVIISANIPSSLLKKTDHGLVLIRPLNVPVTVEAGSISSKDEILEKYNKAISNFNRGYRLFKQEMESRIFIVKPGSKPKLCKIISSIPNSDNVSLEDYGHIKDILDSMKVARQLLYNKSQEKQGRSMEKSNFIQFNNLSNFIDRDIESGGPKWQFLLDTAQIKPIGKFKELWSNLYKKMDIGAQNLYNNIEKVSSLKWIKECQSQ